MHDPNLVTVSLSAFLAVLVVLALLALVIRALTLVFPGAPAPVATPAPRAPATGAGTGDAALVAALHAALARHRPGQRITHIEERTTRGAS